VGKGCRPEYESDGMSKVPDLEAYGDSLDLGVGTFRCCCHDLDDDADAGCGRDSGCALA
jgi:hypothetical protein